MSKSTVLIADEPDEPSGPGQLSIVGFFLVGLWFVLLLWWLATGDVPVKTLADRLNTVGRLTALVGTYLLLWQLLLLARLPWLERAFGMARTVWLHRWNAYLALGLITVHVVTQTVGYQLDDGFSTLNQLGDFIQHYEGLLMAIAGFVLLIVVTALSITIVRRRLSYETWYFVHLYSYLAIALALSHQLATGADFIDNPRFTAYWWALYALVFGSLAVYRVALPVWRYARHGFRVHRVEREATGAVSIYVTGRDLDRFRFEPGQFAIWRFLDARRWWEAHPFSMSATPNGEYLRLTVNRTGDFGAHAAAVREGTPVLVEGPFGRFTRRSCVRPKALLIAGGIGITPIRALAEDLADDEVGVTILYRCHREGDVAFRKELDGLVQDHGIRVEYLISDRTLRGRLGGEWLEPANLRTLVPDIAERDIFVCGPVGMVDKVKRSLGVLEIPPTQIHVEAFRF
jgi:predicted ferric reductase